MTTWKWVLVAALWPACAHAGPPVIHACRDAHGGRVYQDAPCAPGSREDGVRVYAPPRDPPDAARRLEAIDREVHAEWARDRWPALATTRRHGGVGREQDDGRSTARRHCSAARAAAERAARTRRFDGDRASLEEAAVDACFAL